jgi:plasmid stabilization system protein ParE
MSWRIVVLPQALDDIRRNSNWWATHHSLQQAIRWVDAVEEQLAALAFLPESYPVASESSRFPYEIREKLLGLGARPAHRAIFTIKGQAVYVLTVRHSAQRDLQPEDIPPIP